MTPVPLRGLKRNCESISMAGIRKANVFPLPVLAAPSTSLPDSRGGIAFCWISVMFSKPMFLIEDMVRSLRLSSSNRVGFAEGMVVPDGRSRALLPVPEGSSGSLSSLPSSSSLSLSSSSSFAGLASAATSSATFSSSSSSLSTSSETSSTTGSATTASFSLRAFLRALVESTPLCAGTASASALFLLL